MASQLSDLFSLLLAKLKQNSRLNLSAIGAALVLLLAYRLRKSGAAGKLISNLAEVGRRVDGKAAIAKDGMDKGNEYDVIIVGGGTSGCVLASRLTENPNIKVLVIEAGGSGKAVFFSRVPSGFPLIFWNPKYVFQFYTEPQEHANGKKRFWPRAKLLGGCSSINAQMAQYGSPSDFDEWAKLVDDDSWSFNNFKRYFYKMESYQPHPKYPEVDASLRGPNGPVKVGYYSFFTETSAAFIKSCINIGIPASKDFVWGLLGAGRVMTYIDNKFTRVSAESAYLTPEVLARPNLKVVVHATVTRIIFDQSKEVSRAVGVEFANKENGPRYVAYARKEVVVSAGALHTPHILSLSGVGRKEELDKHHIPVISEQPSMGTLVDHPVVDLYLRDKMGISLKYVLRPQTLTDFGKIVKAVWQYFGTEGGGPMASNAGEAVAFVRSDDSKLFPPEKYPQLQDTTSGSDCPDLELFSIPIAYKEHAKFVFDVNAISIHVCLIRPGSVGSVSLRSSSPWDLPLVDPKYLESPDDIQKFIRAIRLLLRIAQTEPMASTLDATFTRPDFDHELHLKTDEEIIEVIKERVETLYHPACTCRMSKTKEEGVVDAKLRVHGVQGLRVCDASVFPRIVSGHTAGACLAVAEKLADEMKVEMAGKT